MALPEQVLAQAEKSNKLIETLSQGPQDAVIGQDGKVIESQPPREKGTVVGDQPHIEKPIVIADPVVPPQSVGSVPKADYDALNQRFLSLDGRNKKEVQGFKEQILSLKSDLSVLFEQNKTLMSDLAGKIAEIKKLMEQTKSEPDNSDSANSASTVSDLDPEVYDQFGVEFRQMADVLNSLNQRIRNSKPDPGKVEPGDQSAAQENDNGMTDKQYDEMFPVFYSKVGDRIQISFQKILSDVDNSEEFKTWLAGIDAMTGNTKQTILNHACATLDIEAAVRVITSFLNENPEFSTKEKDPKKDIVIPNVQPDVPEGGSTDTEIQPVGHVWSRNDIKQFYKDVSAGKFKSDPDRQKRIEADLFAAQQQGRVKD